ncbi:hypothetical protein [Rhodococcus sp. NPDC049939]|uniref:hypothetical protein n=1 Tax=Rhodococcus sp. NPDC049939 TaxID=3155511 RepID=UPI003404D809
MLTNLSQRADEHFRWNLDIYLTLLLLICILGVALIPTFHRWKIRHGAKNAPSPDIQEADIAAKFDGRELVKIDHRRYTITIARMNGIANRFGYYYIGEKGYNFGSVQVAFQKLPAPPPLPIPNFSQKWRQHPQPKN